MSKINVVRPTPILKCFASQEGSRDFNCSIPDGQVGSTSMLERLMLVVFSRLLEAETIVEFGTYRGETTELFMSNKLCKQLISIDLPLSEEEQLADDHGYDLSLDWQNDKFLTKNRNANTDLRLMKKAKTLGIDLKLMKVDSLEFDHENQKGTVDMVFIDGGHSAELIKSDTEKSLEMLSKKGMIFWHDYGSGVHGEVTKYLDSIAEKYEIQAIGDTSLALHIKDESLRVNIFG